MNQQLQENISEIVLTVHSCSIVLKGSTLYNEYKDLRTFHLSSLDFYDESEVMAG